MRTGTFQHTDATGIPSIITIREGEHRGMVRTYKTLIVDTEKCGMKFENLIHIIEPDSKNPLIQVERPLGMEFVRQIIEHVTGVNTLPSTN